MPVKLTVVVAGLGPKFSGNVISLIGFNVGGSLMALTEMVVVCGFEVLLFAPLLLAKTVSVATPNMSGASWKVSVPLESIVGCCRKSAVSFPSTLTVKVTGPPAAPGLMPKAKLGTLMTWLLRPCWLPLATTVLSSNVVYVCRLNEGGVFVAVTFNVAVAEPVL